MKTLENYLKPLMLVSALLFANLAFSKEKAQQMADFIQEFHNYKQFNGNVLVAKEGKILFEKSYGYANFEWDIKHSKTVSLGLAQLQNNSQRC